jgi:hypothetical protein
MAQVFVSKPLTPANTGEQLYKAVHSLIDWHLTRDQLVKDLNRENHLRTLQLIIHADSERVWKMVRWS